MAMNDRKKTKAQLLEEISALQRHIADQDAELVKYRQAKADQQRVFDGLPVLVAIGGFDGYCRNANVAFERTLGWSRQEVLSWQCADFFHPDDRDAANQMFERLRSGETVSDFIGRNVCKDGSYRWLAWVLIPVVERDLIFAIGQDITQRLEAEQALQKAHSELERRVEERTAELNAAYQQLQREVEERRHAEEEAQQNAERYRTLIDVSPDAVVLADVQGRIVFASQQAVRLYGAKTPEELIGQDASTLLAGEDRERMEANLPTLLQNGIRRGTEYRLLCKDGTQLALEGASAVVHDAEGQPQALIAVFRDVTKRKQDQEELERQHRTLLHMLRASDHERQLISYDIHDGLAQQLTAAIMQFQAYEALKSSDPSQSKTAFTAGFQMLRRAHSEARRLISGVRPPILDDSGITAAIAHLVHEYTDRDKPKVTFYSDVKVARLARVMENAIYRIAQESLANALQHSGSDRITVAFTQQEDCLRLEVQDWGVGFDLSAVDESRFGLEGIKERTRLLGGDLVIQSEPGQGTLIRAELPLVEEH